MTMDLFKKYLCGEKKVILINIILLFKINVILNVRFLKILKLN